MPRSTPEINIVLASLALALLARLENEELFNFVPDV